ncbi:SDR family NAD(P)-dependent oxidoreductase [Streptomyces sp. NPDC001339]|uniref:SDR family NAD(P)-dependent oxidoreductase n=1 Tax=Streptomyces sp. NPDC001339 TaxID=3364563 RepID=UPI0036BC9127
MRTTPSPGHRDRAVVVTGASSGLGREMALVLERKGFLVYAGVRNARDGKAVAADAAHGRVRPLLLDIASPESIQEAAARVQAETAETANTAEPRPAAGPADPERPLLWGLVNNAGICVSAPLECIPREELRRQLDVNVIGSVEVTQAMLPRLRAARGRVVNITSGVGSVAFPYLGAYACAQFAKEAFSDALRRELLPHGVRVSVVQPGAIATPIWDKVNDGAARILQHAPAPVADVYRTAFTGFARSNAATAQHSRTTPRQVAAAVAHALSSDRPRIRYRVGQDARTAAALARLLPASALDRMISKLVAR